MFGGDSSGRDYAPHMYVLQVGGDARSDDGYHFVGGATAYYDQRDSSKNNPVSYHIGVTGLGEMVCDVTVSGTTTGLPSEEIPPAAKDKLLAYGLNQMPSMAGFSILQALQIETPDIEPTDYELLFNGTPEQQALELAKEKQCADFVAKIREELLGERPAD